MAKEKTKPQGEPDPDAAAKEPPRGKRRMLVLALTLVLLAAGAGGGGWFYLRGTQASAETNPAPKPAAPPSFVNLEAFTVNLADRDHFLQLGISYEVTDADTTNAMKLHMPILRSRILMLLAAKSAEELGSPEGKTRLARELVEQARDTLPLASSDKGVAAVHFSAFIIQ